MSFFIDTHTFIYNKIYIILPCCTFTVCHLQIFKIFGIFAIFPKLKKKRKKHKNLAFVYRMVGKNYFWGEEKKNCFRQLWSGFSYRHNAERKNYNKMCSVCFGIIVFLYVFVYFVSHYKILDALTKRYRAFEDCRLFRR